jgi:enediyne biosynthesis protein E5
MPQPLLRFKDPRWFQISFQCIFLLYGLFFLNWKADWLHYTLSVGACILLQLAAEFFTNKNYDSWKSALISALSLCLLLKTNFWYVSLLAAALSIGSKYILRYNRKHIFNPSAFGIVATIALTRDAWLSPAQWGSNAIIFFLVITLGAIVITRVQRLDLSLAFLGTFLALLFYRQIIYLHWPLDFFLQSVSTGSLLLFSFFMISDPKTAPNHPAARIIWAMLIAVIAFYLTTFKFINSAPIWVLVGSAPLVWLLDKIFTARAFDWKTFHITSPNSVIVK